MICSLDLFQVQALGRILQGMPASNKGIVRYLFGFLHQVSLASAHNKMTASNLAIVFAPNVLRPIDNVTDNIMQVLADSKKQLAVVDLMIEKHPFLWEGMDFELQHISKGFEARMKQVIFPKTLCISNLGYATS